MDTKLLKQKILDLAIRGKLVPQDPNDEPASVLLERIRAEKERLVAEGKIKRSKSTTDNRHYENVPFEIPNSWEWCAIGEICDTCLGKMLDRQKNHGTNQFYLRNINVRWGAFDLSDLLKMPFEEEEEERYSICYGDLVVCAGGEPGRCAIWNKHESIKFQKALHRVRCHKGIINHFIKIVIELFSSNGLLDDYYTGSTIKHLTGDALRSVVIPLPPTSEQIRIVKEITLWFSLLENLETCQLELQETIKLTKSKILDLAIHGKLIPQNSNDEPASELLKRIALNFNPCDTSHYGNIPQGWTISTVGEVANYINGRAFKPIEWEQEGLPIIRIQNLNDCNASYNCTTATYADKYLIKDGDLLFAWAASLGTYIWNGGDAWLNQHIFKVEPKEYMDKSFLYYSFVYLISEFYRQSHGSGMVHITKGKFENTPILIPPLNEQKRIVTALEDVILLIDTIGTKL